MYKKFKEKINIILVTKPRHVVLLIILLLNIILISGAALVISLLAPADIEGGFWPSIFYTISMILDAGCVQYVVADIGQTSVTLIIVCLITVLIGMITFSGAVIGYITNYISSFIEDANEGERPLNISDHTVILNWNNRAAEIVHDLLFTEKREVIVILVDKGKEVITQRIKDRLSETLKKNPRLARKNTVIIKEGDTYSTEQLANISVNKAKSIIILDDDNLNYLEANKKDAVRNHHGNTNTIKTLIQVAEMTSSTDSMDNQNIIVEVEDDWTQKICETIISHKERLNKCHIIAVPVNKILGSILSQFSIMPELNLVYGELFSNDGAEFFCSKCDKPLDDENTWIEKRLEDHARAIPIGVTETRKGWHEFYVAQSDEDTNPKEYMDEVDVEVSLNPNFMMEQKNIVILGHNSRTKQLMEGFFAFRKEWNRHTELEKKEVLNIIAIDTKENLELMNYYKDCPFVTKCVEADIYDDKLICDTINEFVDENKNDTTVLILSDDMAEPEDVDSNALTYLVYLHDIVKKRLKANPSFDIEKIDVIVEIINPKNYDVVHNYSVNNVVISNRYVSKLLTQIGSKDALYEMYCDILSYDEEDADVFISKEMYTKPVTQFFTELPPECTGAELVRSVYKASPETNKSLVLGFVSPGGRMTLFTGDNLKKKFTLHKKDKIIVYSNH